LKSESIHGVMGGDVELIIIFGYSDINKKRKTYCIDKKSIVQIDFITLLRKENYV